MASCSQTGIYSYDCLLISVVFVVLCHVGCLWVIGVLKHDPLCVQTGVSIMYHSDLLTDFLTLQLTLNLYQQGVFVIHVNLFQQRSNIFIF